MTPDQASKVVEAVRDLARHGLEDKSVGAAREWARELLEAEDLPYWPAEALQLDQEPASFPGIELRVSVDADPVLQADSVHLHLIAKYAGCEGDDWYDPFSPMDGPLTSTSVYVGGEQIIVSVPMKIELRPRMLSLPADPE